MDLRAHNTGQLASPRAEDGAESGDALHHLESLGLASLLLGALDEVGTEPLGALVLLLLLAALAAPLVLGADEGPLALLGVRELGGWCRTRSELEEARVVEVEVVVVLERHGGAGRSEPRRMSSSQRSSGLA